MIQESDTMCKLLLTTFTRFMYVWSNNLKSSFIEGFRDLYAKFVSCFNTSILDKGSSNELFRVTLSDDESINVYLKSFNEKMLKVEEMLYGKTLMPYLIKLCSM